MSADRAFQALPLRQRKFARTKLGLLDAALRALESRPLADVTVKELCGAIPISEASFFNYFPKKTDLLVYYVQLWSLEMEWYARKLASGSGALAAIEEIFALTGRRIHERPRVMAEIIAGQVRMTEAPGFAEVSLAERLLAFPGLAGIEEMVGRGLDDLLRPLVERAVAAGELPGFVDRGAILTALRAIFFGTPVAHYRSRPNAVESAYLDHLRLLWAGLRAQLEGEAERE